MSRVVLASSLLIPEYFYYPIRNIILITDYSPFPSSLELAITDLLSVSVDLPILQDINSYVGSFVTSFFHVACFQFVHAYITFYGQYFIILEYHIYLHLPLDGQLGIVSY